MLKEAPLDAGGVQLNMFFLSKQIPTVAYEFEMIPDETVGSITAVVQELVRQLYTGEIEIPEADKTDVMRSVTIGNGEMAADDRNYDDAAYKILYHMINGTVIASDVRQINWEEQAKNLQNMEQLALNVRNLINALVTRETVEVPIQDPENPEAEPQMVTKRSEEVAETEIARFTESNKLNIDYEMIEGCGIATKREMLIIKLIDILEIHQQMIAATLSVINQQNVASFYEQRIAEMTKTEDDNSEVPSVQAEVVSEE